MNGKVRRNVIALAILFLWCGTAQAAVSPPSAMHKNVSAGGIDSATNPGPMRIAQHRTGPVTYNDIAPILNKSCVMCHSGPKAPRDLRLDSFEDIMKGSSNGPMVVLGKPDESEMLRRITGQSKPRMPMTGPPFLSDQETSLVQQWISDGAPSGTSAATRSEPESKVAVQPPESSDVVTYADVVPLLNSRCTKCHSEKGMTGRPPEGIRLTSYEAILNGSERAVLVPGSPEASSIVRAVKGLSSPRMPHDGPPYLDEHQIELIATWVRDGARDSSGKKPPIPVGASVRLGGHLTGKWELDGLDLVVDGGTRLQKGPVPGDYVEVRGVVLEGGRIYATRIRPR